MRKDKDRLHETLHLFLQKKDKCAVELTDELGSANLVAKQFLYLEIIDNNPDITPGNLAKILNITKPSVTEILKKLQKLNCITKRQDEDDGRVFYIELTDKGKNIARLKSIAHEKLAHEVFVKLNDEERELLIRLLTKIVEE